MYTMNCSAEFHQNKPILILKIYKSIQKTVSDVQPQSLLDYIYAVLHSRAYRQRYAEFLKSDYPRIPNPKDAKTFHSLAAKGEEAARASFDGQPGARQTCDHVSGRRRARSPCPELGTGEGQS